MTKIKICGLTRFSDIEAANIFRPDYVGFVFAPKSSRCLGFERAKELKERLSPQIRAVGVFVDETVETVADLLNGNLIDIAQLHGHEDETFLAQLRKHTDKPIIKAFRIHSADDAAAAQLSSADYILLDSGAGSGKVFDWEVLRHIRRPYFLAGGLTCGNVREAVRRLHPFAADVSSGVETDGLKDKTKIAAFINAVREEDKL